uniref:Olfactory receptor 75 n=1 Tax=Meteorus pulchricornis TaxID=51522 RepID=A0A1S5VFR7_9HYME|nr:olfactory receptor 75 [Meteorus pulchricornis]
MNTPVEKLQTKRKSIEQSSLEDLEWAISLNRVILQGLGLWTYPNESQLRTALSHIHLGMIGVCMCFLIVPQTMAMFKVLSVPMLIVDNVGHNLPFLSAEFKLALLWYNKKDVAHIFELIREDWLMEKSSYERDVMIKYAELYKMLTIGGLLSSLATTTMYHLPIAWNTVSRTVNNITDVPGALFAAQTVYAYDVTQTKTYRLTLISQYVGTVFASLSYTGVDVLFSMFVMHGCGQLEILAGRIETMASEQPNLKHRLKNNVERHCSLIE